MQAAIGSGLAQGVASDAWARFTQDGFTVIPAFVASSELRELRSEVDTLMAETPHVTACERPNNTLVPLRWDDAVVRQLLTARRVARLAAAVDGEDMRWISGYVSSKAPGSGPLWWHQDWWCWNDAVTYQPAATQIAVLCYLVDVDEGNGAPRVLPGSHHRATERHGSLAAAQAIGVEATPADHPAFDDHPQQVTLRPRAGDAVILDYRLLHGTHSNPSPDRRDAVLLSFAPSWRCLPRRIRGHLIRNGAQPTQQERSTASSGPVTAFLPDFDGPGRDLDLSRVPPDDFEIHSMRTPSTRRAPS